MMEDSELVLCYNRGCGNTFHPNKNHEDSCTYHPGDPVFHDAYKGWSCCNKKCTDFTEFLNIKGCTKAFHSNVKPAEPVRPVVDKSKVDEIIEYKAPVPIQSKSIRPPFESELSLMAPEILETLKTQFEGMVIKEAVATPHADILVAGTACKNGGCKVVYEDADTIYPACVHHPGYPVFHEGLKFWSCCKKRTTDFSAFLDQVGCTTVDHHQWFKPKDGGEQSTNCRYDWHQTGSHVIITIYAKKYDPYKSTIHLNPVRAKIHIEFPQEEAAFNVDWELRGVINVAQSQALMTPTKVELKFKKSEPGTWAKLDFPREVPKPEKPVEPKVQPVLTNTNDEAVDLSDIY